MSFSSFFAPSVPGSGGGAASPAHRVLLLAALLAGTAHPLPSAMQVSVAPPVIAAAEKIRSGHPLLARTLAAERLVGMGASARSSALAMARSPDTVRRVGGLFVLRGIREPARIFVPFLRDPSPAVRKAALEGIRDAPGEDLPGEGIPPLQALLHDPFWSVRRTAVEVWAARFQAPDRASHVLEGLRDSDPLVRKSALRSLADLDADLSPGTLAAAVSRLSPGEKRLFLSTSLPLVRRANLAFFLEWARRARGTPEGVLALATAAADTRSVDPECIPWLLRCSLEGDPDAANGADVLLALAGRKIVTAVHAAMADASKDGKPLPPTGLVHILLSVLDRESVPYLGAWVTDPALPAKARSACLEGLVLRDWPEGADMLVRVFPRLQGALKRDAVWKAFALARTRVGARVEPLLLAAVKMSDPKLRNKAFEGLCLLPAPPIERLVEIFRNETDPGRRRDDVARLVNAARGAVQERIALLFLEEIEHQGPAAIEAASQLHRVITGEALAKRAVEAVRACLRGKRDPSTRETLILGLAYLDRPDADRAAARAVQETLAEGGKMDLPFLVAHLDETHGPYTLALLHELFPGSEEEVQRRILRTLVRRHDTTCAPWVEALFHTARLGYKRSILEDMKDTPVAEACAALFRGILRRERDPDLLAAALEAAPRSVLEAERKKLLTLAELGPELGLDTTEAVFRALARAGGEEGRAWLRNRVAGLAGPCTPDGENLRAAFMGGEADIALLAAAALASVRDEAAPALLAGLLFLRSLALRKAMLMATWSHENAGLDGGKAHGWERAVLRNLLCFEDSVVEDAAAKVLKEWSVDGRLFSCGDAAFCTVSRVLAARNRCPVLRERLAALTLRCAPVDSPSDFRILLRQADAAEAAGDPATAASALRTAYRILRFHPPARSVVRSELGDIDPFLGYFPEAALASDMHHRRALALQASGQEEAAALELLKAKRRSPFRRD